MTKELLFLDVQQQLNRMAGAESPCTSSIGVVMADQVTVNSVQPSEVSAEMVAYLLTVCALNASSGKGWQTSTGLPILYGHDKDAILSTYADCIKTVRTGMTPDERAERASRR